MAQLSKVAFLSKWAGLFADNATRLISEADMRDFRLDIADSFFGIVDDAYTKPFPVIVTTGTNSYAGTAAPAITAYVNYQEFLIKIANTSSAVATLNLNTIGSKKIFKTPTTQAASSDLVAGQIYLIVYDAALDTASGGFLIVAGVSSSGGGIQSIVAGTNVTVDATDPDNPIVNATGINEVGFTDLSTGSGTLDLNFGGQWIMFFRGQTSFSTAKSITLSNDSNGYKFDLSFTIGSVAATLTFPSGFISDTSYPGWDTALHKWTSDAIGKFRVTGTFDGIDWFLEFTKAPYA
jgi:hypothetical protein